jgi:carbamoyltransferase
MSAGVYTKFHPERRYDDSRYADATAITVGVSGARRNAAAAVAGSGGLAAVCEQERVTRTRGAGILPGGLPDAAIDCVLRCASAAPAHERHFATTEDAIGTHDGGLTRFDHHQAHAMTAYWSAPAQEAVVLVCDRRSSRELTVWQATEHGVEPLEFEWRGQSFASVYSRLAEAFNFSLDDDEHRLEALARLGSPTDVVDAEALMYCPGDCLVLKPELWTTVRDWNIGGKSPKRRADVAATLQRRIGALLQEFVCRIRRVTGGDTLCLAGGLFFNSSITTTIAESGAFGRTFVAVNPGNAGVAAGAALLGAGATKSSAQAASPFLGPSYGPADVKATLDNCKLSYEFLREGALVERAVSELVRGHLVGWFQGPMEWGARALGHRSIFASPVGPHVLDNLNVFLKHREPHRPYSLSVCIEDLDRYFVGPPDSPLMEHEYVVRDPDLFAGVMPSRNMRLRVQSVDHEPALFRSVLKAIGSATGIPVLVNTSFNGLHEPIVCSPRDAVRVFYGTGLDAVAIGNFWMTK